MDDGKIYKLSDFVKLMGVSRSTVVKWISKGKLELSISMADGIFQNRA